MNSKQRAYLKGLAQTIQPILNIGKSSLTPEFTESVAEALEARELIKISVLKNCLDDPREIAAMLGERTHSQVVQVIGRKIVLYKESKEHKRSNFHRGNKPCWHKSRTCRYTRRNIQSYTLWTYRAWRTGTGTV